MRVLFQQPSEQFVLMSLRVLRKFRAGSLCAWNVNGFCEQRKKLHCAKVDTPVFFVFIYTPSPGLVMNQWCFTREKCSKNQFFSLVKFEGNFRLEQLRWWGNLLRDMLAPLWDSRFMANKTVFNVAWNFHLMIPSLQLAGEKLVKKQTAFEQTRRE